MIAARSLNRNEVGRHGELVHTRSSMRRRHWRPCGTCSSCHYCQKSTAACEKPAQWHLPRAIMSWTIQVWTSVCEWALCSNDNRTFRRPIWWRRLLEDLQILAPIICMIDFAENVPDVKVYAVFRRIFEFSSWCSPDSATLHLCCCTLRIILRFARCRMLLKVWSLVIRILIEAVFILL